MNRILPAAGKGKSASMDVLRLLIDTVARVALPWAVVLTTLAPVVVAQDDNQAEPQAAPAEAAQPSPDERFEDAMAAGARPLAEPPDEDSTRTMNLLRMASPQVGGVFLYPIYGFSFVVVLFGIERAIGLRRRKVLPPRLIGGVEQLLASQGGFDPRKAFRLCQKYPSAAANVLRAALLKTGRPLSDLELATSKSLEHEAARLYNNVRPLNLSATVAPLLGLIGTVQGMIVAFYRTAYLPDGANKAQALAEGVYIALVTTFAGLCVAIPAVCLAHLFEGKIQRLFQRLEKVTEELLPALERYEGRLRVVRPGSGTQTDGIQYGAKEPEVTH